mmetsp:Transcript_13611/g.28772  ORF Transcript_13611/g.28772 Transcript_13611/m.28772 type:complete len:332 (+) Transcript_13611:190-1185(+)
MYCARAWYYWLGNTETECKPHARRGYRFCFQRAKKDPRQPVTLHWCSQSEPTKQHPGAGEEPSVFHRAHTPGLELSHRHSRAHCTVWLYSRPVPHKKHGAYSKRPRRRPCSVFLPRGGLADNVFVLASVFADHNGHLLFVDLGKTVALHDSLHLVLRSDFLVGHGIQKSSEPPATRSVLGQPAEGGHHDDDAPLIHDTAQSIEARNGIRQPTKQVRHDNTIVGSLRAVQIPRSNALQFFYATRVTHKKVDLLGDFGCDAGFEDGLDCLGEFGLDGDGKLHFLPGLHALCGSDKIVAEIKGINMVKTFGKLEGRPSNGTSHVQGLVCRAFRV